MATLYETDVRERGGRDVVTARRAAGDMRLKSRSRLHDVRNELVGGFAGPVPPDAPVGTFGNLRHLRRQGTGSFVGDSDWQRQGSFADTVVVAGVAEITRRAARLEDVPRAA